MEIKDKNLDLDEQKLNNKNTQKSNKFKNGKKERKFGNRDIKNSNTERANQSANATDNNIVTAKFMQENNREESGKGAKKFKAFKGNKKFSNNSMQDKKLDTKEGTSSESEEKFTPRFHKDRQKGDIDGKSKMQRNMHMHKKNKGNAENAMLLNEFEKCPELKENFDSNGKRTGKNKLHKKSNPNALKIIFLGGVGEIGKNMTALEYGKEIIIIDAGLTFPAQISHIW